MAREWAEPIVCDGHTERTSFSCFCARDSLFSHTGTLCLADNGQFATCRLLVTRRSLRCPFLALPQMSRTIRFLFPFLVERGLRTLASRRWGTLVAQLSSHPRPICLIRPACLRANRPQAFRRPQRAFPWPTVVSLPALLPPARRRCCSSSHRSSAPCPLCFRVNVVRNASYTILWVSTRLLAPRNQMCKCQTAKKMK